VIYLVNKCGFGLVVPDSTKIFCIKIAMRQLNLSFTHLNTTNNLAIFEYQIEDSHNFILSNFNQSGFSGFQLEN